MALSTVTEAPGATGTGLRTAATAGAVLGALGSAGYMSGVYLLEGTNAENLTNPLTIVESIVAAIGYLLVAVTLPGLASVSRLPRWALTVASAACVFIVVQAWTTATLFVHLADRVEGTTFETLGEPPAFWFDVWSRSLALFALIGFIGLAIAGWRRKAFSKGASLLLILSVVPAVVIPAFAPVGIFAGIGLAWAARSLRT